MVCVRSSGQKTAEGDGVKVKTSPCCSAPLSVRLPNEEKWEIFACLRLVSDPWGEPGGEKSPPPSPFSGGCFGHALLSPVASCLRVPHTIFPALAMQLSLAGRNLRK